MSQQQNTSHLTQLIILVLILILLVLWFYQERGFEPLVTILIVLEGSALWMVARNPRLAAPLNFLSIGIFIVGLLTILQPEDDEGLSPTLPSAITLVSAVATSTFTPTIMPSTTPTPTRTAMPTNMPQPTATSPPTRTPTPQPELRCTLTTTPFSRVWESVKLRTGCPTAPAITALAAEERFERGYMFWREPIDTAHALVALDTGGWQRFSHMPFGANDPEFGCIDANTPPQCPPTPKRGFGKMWCDIPAIRQGLGNATNCERGYQGTMQTFEHAFMLGNDQGRVFVFYENGAWEVY